VTKRNAVNCIIANIEVLGVECLCQH